MRRKWLINAICMVMLFAPFGAYAEPCGANPASESMELLITGNTRFRQGKAEHPHQARQQLLAVTAGQHPFVAVLGCSDSRVPPEIVFDQGVGDILM